MRPVDLRLTLATGLCLLSLTVGPRSASAQLPAPPERVVGTRPTKYTTPVITSARQGTEQVQLAVTYRSDTGVPISARQPLRLRLGKTVVILPLVTEPTRTSEIGPTPGTLIYTDRARYEMPVAAYTQLRGTPAAAVTVAVHDGRKYRRYPFVSGDPDSPTSLQP